MSGEVGRTAREKAEEVALRLWPDLPLLVERLDGGATNSNFKVTLEDGSRYVIRVFGQSTGVLQVNREAEVHASRVASSLGLGAAVTADMRDEGVLVLEFLPGVPVTSNYLKAPETLRRVAHALRTLHAGPPFMGVIDPFKKVEFLYETALATGGVNADSTGSHEWASVIAERIRSAVDFAITSPCHGDLLASNFLDDGSIRLLDWEYAGQSDPRFDLANLSFNQHFTKEDDRRLVQYYYDEDNKLAEATIRLLRFVSAWREAMWCTLQHNISELDIDYLALSKKYFEQMERTAEDDQFEHCFAILDAASVGKTERDT